MTKKKQVALRIEYAFFELAFGRDSDYHDTCPENTYLDRESGALIYGYVEDEDAYMEAGIPEEENKSLRNQVEQSPNRYVEIPGRSHGEHHEILREFLASNWTDNVSLREQTEDAYFGSIGGWIKAVRDRDIVHAYYNFKDARLRELGEEFLKEHGIDPEWT